MALGAFLFAATPLPLPAVALAAMQVVPEGNRSSVQPKIPFASARRTAANRSSYDAKFDKVISVLRRDTRLIRSIKQVSAQYGIDPVHMLGAIIGEHTYNYDSLDSAQSYYVKALSYAGIRLDFEYGGENVEDFVARPEFDSCRSKRDSNHLWTCYERLWERTFRNKRVNGVRYPNKNFNETFFQPLFAGQSFGLGQLSPLTVLKMSDSVARTSGFRKLSPRDANEIYSSTMDPNRSLHYMAAVIRDSIQAYKSVAKVDISQNPGITATLYNLGDPWARAANFRQQKAAGKTAWPRENYYGWLVNARLDTLRSLL
ncbi:DUF1402 family protein [Stappia sp. GBMRC 2046]|uniref:DUF1402 family protein n=1 Tax=Stappia sediminis TaxID=2692190 RepID=A0A7X3LQT2_9HYPH|nr:DUF1402 family protein [Stappia sediminis]MXN63398.1 DUF1402 family protein [Stappia sediminis]